MRLHRFFCPEPVGNRTELSIRSSALVNQLRRVFRLKIGEEIVIFDGSGSDYKAAIARFDGADCVVLEHLSPSPSRYMPKQKIYLAAALIKKDHFEMVAEKATELGVTDIVPLIAERSEKKALNPERLQKIITEASEQSGRGDVPKLHEVMPLSDFLAKLEKTEPKPTSLVFDPEGEVWSPSAGGLSGPAVVFVGPEGGWSPSELDLFHSNSAKMISLGRQVLRAETAVIAALSMVLLGQQK